MIKKYSSIVELALHAKTCDPWPIYSDFSWFNNETFEQSINFALNGNTSLVKDAEKLIALLETSISVPRRAFTPSPAGAFAIIPEYLSGVPTCMRAINYEESEVAPINIVVNITASGAIDAKTMQKRGTTILALVLALSQIRPVNLFCLVALDGRDNGETILLAQINTTPLDLATACYCLTSAGFLRRLCFSIERKINDYTGKWPTKYNRKDFGLAYQNDLIIRLGFDPENTLSILGAHLKDSLLSEPLIWVQSQINHFTREKE